MKHCWILLVTADQKILTNVPSLLKVLEILQKNKEEYLNVMKLGHTKRLEQSYFANVTQSMLQAKHRYHRTRYHFFPEFCTGLTLQDVVENLQNEYSINIDNLDEILTSI